MKKVLIITDLSNSSKAGIKFGLQLAAQCGYDLHFYNMMEVMKPTSWDERRYKSYLAHRKAEIETEIRTQVKEAGQEAGHQEQLYPVTVEDGNLVARNAIRYARKIKADFICLGTRGGGKLRKILGSNATDLLIGSPKPVIVVPPVYLASTLTKLMYASDFENLGAEIKKVKSVAADLAADVVVYHYNRTLVISKNQDVLKKKASRYGDERTHFKFRKQDVDASIPELLKKDIRNEKPSALIIFAKSRPNWYNRLFSPGRSAQMILKPTLPIIVYRKK